MTSQWSLKRPATIDEMVVGNPDILTLAKSIAKSAQAVLINGESGTGKSTLAFAMSREINDKFDKSCTIYRDASSQTIDSIRELQAQIRYKPPGNKWVVILDEIHGYSGQALKALLTLIESPPHPRVLFVLCTDQTFALPPQLKNRCRKIEIQKPTYDDAKGYLYRFLKREKVELAEKPHYFKLIKKALEASDFCMRETLQTLEDYVTLIQSGTKIAEVLGLEKGESKERRITNVDQIAGSLLLAVCSAHKNLDKSLSFILPTFTDLDPVAVLSRMQGILYYGFSLKHGGKFNWQAKSYDAIFGKNKPSVESVARITYETGRLLEIVKNHNGDKAILAASGLAHIAMRESKLN